MACPAISTGNNFLSSTLSHIDCQAQTIGSFGFAALSDPASPISQALSALLVIFVAIFGLRLLLGYSVGAGDVVTAFLKVGIVLTLATSWPAYRTVVYDTVLHGPAELAGTIGGASGLSGTDRDFANRLQTTDDAILALTALGSGRFQNAGGTVSEGTIAEAFRPIAVSDQLALGSARVAWLTGTIGALAIVRIGAGLLLALAPLLAGLLLFAATRSIFVSWLKGLALMALGSLAITITLAVEITLLEQLLQSALDLRIAGLVAPSAPTELLVITAAFSIVLFAMIAIMARLVFGQVATGFASMVAQAKQRSQTPSPGVPAPGRSQTGSGSRSYRFVEAIETSAQRDRGNLRSSDILRRISVSEKREPESARSLSTANPRPLGSGFARTRRRKSRASINRDRPS